MTARNVQFSSASHSAPFCQHLRKTTAREASRGLSLLEVLLALSILGVSFFAIGELMRVGARSAEAARDHTAAQLLGESIMAQITAGMLPPESISSAPVDDARYQVEWSYSIQIEPVDQQGLIAVWVTVQQDADQVARPVTYKLVRWMIDPTTQTTTE